ncbi:4Fe-4S binding protein [Williamsia sterculiae]|uniref:ferredoxin--NADP(+) reductase n=1 Tax=Williamsia sterculiae TaxID=1344003 RepID=A0A1N7FH11_9NOCA|nr:4Fe-4S binding protein [Williamsia sterculiae]SIR99570.1 ferredoxin--NADP+ reductase [Williamsia sterculiae]
MPHVVTQACCGDASCVYACPVNCIHPTPDEPDFLTSEMLYIDPSTCVDCGACVSACPVGAIVPGHRLADEQLRYLDVNAAHYAEPEPDAVRFPVDPGWRLPLAPIQKPKPLQVPGGGDVEVAVVGSGPSAMYAADELLRYPNVRIRMYERLDRPFGLARFGVAPDHLSTRKVMRLFDDVARNPNLEILLNTEIGRDISLADLRARSHAVIWAGGAETDRRLQIPGADVAGVCSATEFVGWYNGHPDFADRTFDLSTPRVVIVGNGNVALDVARILTADPESLASTSISREALTALRASKVEEVMVVGRRDAGAAAFTLPELIGLIDGGASVTVDAGDLAQLGTASDTVTATKLDLLTEAAGAPHRDGPVIRFAFLRSPHEIVSGANGSVAGIRFIRNEMSPAGAVVPTDRFDDVDTGLVLTSIGYRGLALPGLPFDEARGVIPNDAGRVVGDDGPMPGMYVTGWIKRGPSGFIGTNKTDSADTIASFRADLEAGLLRAPTQPVRP